MENKTIGIIGYGNMGSTIAQRIGSRIEVFDQDLQKTKDLKGLVVEVLSAANLVQNNDIIILAVKPQDFAAVLELINKIKATNKLFISIAAGITLNYLEKNLGNARVIRAMPNMPAQVGKGITGLAKGNYATDFDLEAAKEIFSYVGKVLVVEEKMIDSVTAVSGSGPAYVCNFLETNGVSIADIPLEKKNKFINEFILAAQGVGFSLEQAKQLVEQTYQGTIRFLEEKKTAPAQLRQQVTSKGGTTEAALSVLQQNGSLTDAVKAALKRAQELSKKS